MIRLVFVPNNRTADTSAPGVYSQSTSAGEEVKGDATESSPLSCAPTRHEPRPRKGMLREEKRIEALRWSLDLF